MASNIKTLKEDNGDIVYPQTLADAVYTNNNTTIETELAKYVTAEDIAQSVASFGTITGSMIADNTIPSDKVILSSFIDLFYPVGSYYETSDTTFDPNVSWTGTWVEDTAGKVLVSKDTATFDTVGDTGGIERTRQAGYVPPINSASSQNANKAYLDYAEAMVNDWLTGDGSSSTISRTIQVASVAGNVNNDANSRVATEAGYYSYTSTNLQPYIVVKRWHRTA